MSVMLISWAIPVADTYYVGMYDTSPSSIKQTSWRPWVTYLGSNRESWFLWVTRCSGSLRFNFNSSFCRDPQTGLIA